MDTNSDFPTVTPNDPSDVAIAIETARALWRRGDSLDSLRWLQRAAESAEAEGDDMRALTLARAAADLREQVRPSGPPSGATIAAPPPAPEAPAAPPRETPDGAAASGAQPSNPLMRGSNPLMSKPLPQAAPPAAPPSDPTKTPPASLPPPSSFPMSPSPIRTIESSSRTPIPPPPKLNSSPPAAPAGTSNGTDRFDLDAPPRTLEPPPAARTPVPTAGPSVATRVALRVSVESFSRGSGALLVRLLGENDPLPRGASEALLVPTGAGVDLRSLTTPN